MAAPGHIEATETTGSLDLTPPGGGVGVSIVCIENVFTERLK